MLTACAIAFVLGAPLGERAAAGVVLDAASRTPVASARVSAGDRQASTDSSGRFEVVIPSGHARLTVSAPGYQDATVELAEATTDVEILLIARARFREQLDVTAEDTPDQAAVLPVRPRQVLTVAGAMDNVFRVLQTLPGVAATEEFGSRLSVRGGTPDQNLTVMDGVEIHNPYRLFGLTSAFNPETVERFELTAGGFGAKLRRPSVLAADRGQPSRCAATADGAARPPSASPMPTSSSRESCPKGTGGSWLLTGRRTYYDLVAERFVDQDLPAFNDLQGSARWERGPG